MIRLVSHNGAPVALYTVEDGEITAADGRHVEFCDLPDLIVAHASQALQLAAHGRKVTAQKFAREATALHDAYLEARAYRAAQQAARLIVSRAGQDWSHR